MANKNVDLNKLMFHSGQGDEPIIDEQQYDADFHQYLNDLIGIIMGSSKTVLGNVKSISFKFGVKKHNPNNLLVVFNNELYGFEDWGTKKKKRWKYVSQIQRLDFNGAYATKDKMVDFIKFVQRVIQHLEDNDIIISKDVSKAELLKVN